MQVSFSTKSRIGTGTYVVGALEDAILLPAAKAADSASGGALSCAIKATDFKAKAGEVLEILAPAGLSAARVLIAGLGPVADITPAVAEKVGAQIFTRLPKTAGHDISFDIDLPGDAPVSSADFAAHTAFGLALKSYNFAQYRTKDAPPAATVKKAAFTVSTMAAAKKTWARMEAVADGVTLARDLINEPPNVLTPPEYARRAKALSKTGLKVKVLGEAQMKKLGMGALLGVGQGSAHESQLVILEWNGAKSGRTAKAPIAFIGKGMCFDSGGLSLKSGPGMVDMKGDMGGAAAVTGAMVALATRKAPVHAVGVLALAENMPDGAAQRPDDIVTTMSGQTVEIGNTDAEGRLVLADAIWYTQKTYKPSAMVDLATLTGAIMIALGGEYAGLFSNNDALAERISAAGTATGEKVWRMPLAPAYDKLLKSKFADMKNVGGRQAGSITAAQFLKRFTNDVPWAHLDIAGTAWNDQFPQPLNAGWATGWGVRILEALATD